MGNQQSNERRRNYKIYKIVDKDVNSDWVRYYLDDYVTYDNGNHKSIDFERRSQGRAALGIFVNIMGGDDDLTSSFSIGDYIRIDNEETRAHNKSFNFTHSKYYLVARGGTVGSSNLDLISGMGESVVNNRIERARRMEQARFENQTQAWHLEPPKK